jgi:hypothetical protein
MLHALWPMSENCPALTGKPLNPRKLLLTSKTNGNCLRFNGARALSPACGGVGIMEDELWPVLPQAVRTRPVFTHNGKDREMRRGLVLMESAPEYVV